MKTIGIKKGWRDTYNKGHMRSFAQFGTILYNLNNVKNNHGGVLLFEKMQAEACNFTKVTLLHGCFSRYLNYTNGSNLRKASQ